MLALGGVAVGSATCTVSNRSSLQCNSAVQPKENRKAEVLSSPAISMLMSIIRDQRTCQADYVRASDRLMAILAEGHNICAVDIVRSGGILLEAVRKVIPELKTAKILIQRDEATALPQLYYSKLPDGIEKLQVLLCDPMLGTGGSALTAIEVLKKAGVKEENILFINVVSCPEGLKALAMNAPDVRILTCALDSHLNEVKFIVPGVGDFGDRYYGTTGYAEGLWGTNGR